MDISPVGFYLFAGVAIACSLLVVFKKSPVSSAFSLILVFAAFAGIYANLAAHLVAALQVLVYAGAIMVLFIFVIMLLSADEPSFDMGRSHPLVKALVGFFCVALFVMFVWALKKSDHGQVLVGPYSVAAVAASGGNSKVVSQLMFTRYILPFELTSILLLAGIVGAIALAKRNLGKEGK
ncbi:MAG: NADH-quinone oxidoreductase subunit J [Cryobacterium sp.]|nr:NADH-quinone oxidoreductase subunit J [Oligoflexia bacterium]